MGRQILLCLSISLLSLNFADAVEKGLVAYWAMDGNAKDASGNGHDGIVQGAKFVDGVVGKSAEFDGGAAWINGGRKPSLEVSPMSCTFWMRPSHDLGS